jgi:hypothetical protein
MLGTLLSCYKEFKQVTLSCIVTRLDDTCSRFDKGENFSLLNCVQATSEAHPASYPVGNGGFFRGNKLLLFAQTVPRSYKEDY